MKTPIGIGLYLEAKNNKVINGPGMVVVKASLKTQWLREVNKFSDLKANIIQTSSEITSSIKDKIKRRKALLKKGVRNKKKLTKKDIKDINKEIESLSKEAEKVFRDQFEDQDLFILNYETLRDDNVRKMMHRKKIDFIFADEVQMVKSKTSKRSKALYEFGTAKMKVGATATPVTKNPEDLFGLFKLIDPKLFSNWNQFANLYIKYAGYGRISGFKNLEHLRNKISPYLIVKDKSEIADQLPELVVMQRYCDLSPDQYDMTQKIFEELDDLKEQEYKIRQTIFSEAQLMNNTELHKIEAKILALQTFAQEIADSVKLLEESDSEMAKQYICKGPNNKLELLAELIEEIVGSGEKVAIFSRFAKMQPIIAERIAKIDKDIKIAYVNGSISGDQRYEEVYTKFRDKDEYKVLLLSDAGAEGLNLSKCKYLIEVEPAISHSIQTQRHGRIERADSIHENAFVYQLIANDSYDEIGLKIIAKKETYDLDLIRS